MNTPVDYYSITISYNSNNIFDSSLINVPFDVDNGTVTVLKPTPGDVNRDGNINMKDLVLIQQLINHWDVHIDERAADVNDDGEINMPNLLSISFLSVFDSLSKALINFSFRCNLKNQSSVV